MAYLISVVAITIAFSSAFTSAAPTTSAAAAITPSVKSVQLLGFANDTSFNAALYRDGGGGGMTGLRTVLSNHTEASLNVSQAVESTSFVSQTL